MRSALSEEYAKPLPTLTKDNTPYWEGAKRNELQLQKCLSCNTSILYPRSICPKCGSSSIEWFKSKGTGTIYSYTTVHRATPAFKDDSPYVVVIVELSEGPLLVSNLVDYAPNQLKVGQEVKVVFDKVTEDFTLPKFSPI